MSPFLDRESTLHAIFSRSGFDPALTAIAAVEPVLLIDPSQMFAGEIVDANLV